MLLLGEASTLGKDDRAIELDTRVFGVEVLRASRPRCSLFLRVVTTTGTPEAVMLLGIA